MKKKDGILILCLIAFMSGNVAIALETTTNPYGVTGQNYGISDNKICIDPLMQELVKQTIYTVGSQVLNKYLNNNAPVYTNPSIPVNNPIYTPSPVTQSTVQPQLTTTTTPNQQDPIIIIK